MAANSEETPRGGGLPDEVPSVSDDAKPGSGAPSDPPDGLEGAEPADLSSPGGDSIDALVAKWRKAAAGVREAVGVPPIDRLLGEALELSGLVDAYWEPSGDGRPRPGLRAAVPSGTIPESLAEDLRELATAVARVRSEHRDTRLKQPVAPVARGRFLLREMRRCIAFVFAAHGSAEERGGLARLNQSHNITRNHDGLAMSMEGFALFADKHRARLAAETDLDLEFLDEAIGVASRLREQSAFKLSGPERERQRRALSLRMNAARHAFRHVFREHPKVLARVGSEYQRQRRAAHRAAQRRARQPRSHGPPGGDPPGTY